MLLQEEWDADHDLLAIAMTAVLAGAGISTSLATAFGLPVSATHGAISGLTAVALFERGWEAVNGSGLAFTVLGWVASPLVGGLVAGGLSALIERKIFRAPNPAAEAHRMRPALVAGTLGLIQVFLCSKGPTWLRLPWWGNCIGFVLTVAVSALAVQKGGKLPMETAWLVLGGDAPSPGRAIDRLSPVVGVVGVSRPPSPPGEEGESLLSPTPAADGVPSEDASEEPELEGTPAVMPRQSSSQERQVEVAEQQFTGLLVLTGCTVAFAHGGNDVGNSTGPLLIAL